MDLSIVVRQKGTGTKLPPQCYSQPSQVSKKREDDEDNPQQQ
jgi:hypothetical protein